MSTPASCFSATKWRYRSRRQQSDQPGHRLSFRLHHGRGERMRADSIRIRQSHAPVCLVETDDKNPRLESKLSELTFTANEVDSRHQLVPPAVST